MPNILQNQYNANMIGITRFDVVSFKKLAKLKNNHYNHLSEIGYIQYQELYQKTLSLLTLSDIEIENIIKRELVKHSQPLWWQIIIE